MTVKLKDVKGLLVEKKNEVSHGEWAEGFNEAIDFQGERSLTLNREKLAKCIESFYNRNLMKDVRDKGLSDAIIQALPEILEVSHE